MGKVTRKCLVCLKDFTFFSAPSRSDNNRNKYCSRECSYKGRQKTVLWTCKECGVQKYLFPCRAKKYIYCSKTCSIAAKVGKGYDKVNVVRDRLHSIPKYKVWRKKVLNKNNGMCIKCENLATHAHHIYFYNFIAKQFGIKNITDAVKCKDLWDINNGAPMCIVCHYEYHSRCIQVGKWIKSKTSFKKIKQFQVEDFHGWSKLLHKVISHPLRWESLNEYTPAGAKNIWL